MFDGLQSGHRTEVLIEDGRRRTRGFEQRAPHMKGGGFVTDGVRLETIAGRE
jgi:hypothetical protein